MKSPIVLLSFSPLVLAAAAFAQPTAPPAPAQPPGAPQAPGPPQAVRASAPVAPVGLPAPAAAPLPPSPPTPRASRPPMERAMPPGRWWDNPMEVQNLGLTPDQQKRMDDIFQQNRLRLVDLNANLEKEEIIMEPMMQQDSPDENRVLAQIDKVAQARAELEKANARFLLGIRRILTQDQWKKLQSTSPTPRLAPTRSMMPATPPPPPAKRR